MSAWPISCLHMHLACSSILSPRTPTSETFQKRSSGIASVSPTYCSPNFLKSTQVLLFFFSASLGQTLARGIGERPSRPAAVPTGCTRWRGASAGPRFGLVNICRYPRLGAFEAWYSCAVLKERLHRRRMCFSPSMLESAKRYWKAQVYDLPNNFEHLHAFAFVIASDGIS